MHHLQKEIIEERIWETEATMENAEQQYTEAEHGVDETSAECERLITYAVQPSGMTMQVNCEIVSLKYFNINFFM